jgi:hypothetical protein
MQIAWMGSMSFALQSDWALGAFRKATGNTWTPGIGLDAMIDRATGADLDFIRKFAKWHNENLWGETAKGKPMGMADCEGGE